MKWQHNNSIAFSIIVTLLLHSCGGGPDKLLAEYKEESELRQIAIEGIGQQLLKKHCSTCHNPSKSHDYLGISVRAEWYDVDFFHAYITNKDSLKRVDSRVSENERYYNLRNAHQYKFSKTETNAIYQYLKRDPLAK